MEENHNNFLQSDIWRKFQEAVGYQTFHLELKSPSNPPFEKGEGFCFSASIIEHKLPVVGKYFYISRGSIIGISNDQFPISNKIPNPKSQIDLLINLAKKENASWIRIEPENAEMLEIIKKNVDYKIVKAPHDMQPREILVMDISKSEEELLARMKSKTRYNIKLAEKHGVKVFKIENNCHPELVSGSNELDSSTSLGMTKKYVAEFIRLIKLTEKRKDIKFHSADYYQKMLEVIPSDVLKLYVAEYNSKVIAANLVVFFGDTATYLHGATDDEYRNVMAPYLLQWQAIKDAKKTGCKFYDFGGIKTQNMEHETWNSWQGITKFKLGFAPATESIKFPGSYDLVINTPKYFVYRIFSQLKSIF
ncbi:aminoacyltransferase [Patescibacteria group bacterium]|nr:aminoacyltransferase [Patescibacteria group bacterium]